MVTTFGSIPASARADSILLDQLNAGLRNGGIGVGVDPLVIAQTFSVGITGVLTQLDLGVFNPNVGSTRFVDPLSIQIRRTSAGRPDDTVLQSMTVPVAAVTPDRFAMTSYEGWHVDVQAGEQLAIVLATGPNGNYGWSTSCCYSGGDMFLSLGSGFRPIVPTISPLPADFMFRTFVDASATTTTPEPESLPLLAGGLAVAFFGRWRRSRVTSTARCTSVFARPRY